MTLLSAEQVTSIRTCSQINVPVYFYFEGTLFEYNNLTHETKPISYFMGFNCAARKDKYLVDSFEYVKFSNEKLETIYNPQVTFALQNTTSISYAGTLVLDFAIPVNRQNYTALEHFTFVCEDITANNLMQSEDYNYFETKIGWTRFSDPKRKTYVEPQQDKWLYAAKGYKTPGHIHFTDKFAEFNFAQNEKMLLERWNTQ